MPGNEFGCGGWVMRNDGPDHDTRGQEYGLVDNPCALADGCPGLEDQDRWCKHVPDEQAFQPSVAWGQSPHTGAQRQSAEWGCYGCGWIGQGRPENGVCPECGEKVETMDDLVASLEKPPYFH